MANSEDAILNLLGKYFPNSHPSFIMGRGDDCALITIPLANAFSTMISPCLAPSSPSTKDVQCHHDKNSPKNTSTPNASTPNNSSLGNVSLGNSPLASSALLAVTSDIFTENAHFRTRYFSPAQIGHKALAVNISDLAGNGARPSAFSLNLTLTDMQDSAWLEEFFASMAKLSQYFNMGLSGGDLAKAPSPKANTSANANINANTNKIDPMHINIDPANKNTLPTHKNTHFEDFGALNIGITAWGDYGHGGIPLLRHKSYTPKINTKNGHVPLNTSQKASLTPQDFCYAKEGDYIFVIGEIGLARTGLFALESTANKKEIQDKIKLYPLSCNAHLSPMPLVLEGLFLSQFALNHPIFLMDISDGLMRDLPRLLARQGLIEENTPPLGAKIHIAEHDLNQEVLTFAKSINHEPVHFAYSGGEDYGLLGICSKNAWEELQKKWQENPPFAKLWKIGEICQENLTLNGIIIKENGFDHFHR